MLPSGWRRRNKFLCAINKCGAFFGCAVPVEDEKILFYYTGHYGDHGKDREAEEAQVMVENQDSISFGTDRTEDLRYL